jgi:hypothetical protein
MVSNVRGEGGCSNVRLSNVRAPVVLTLEFTQSLVQILILIFIKLYGGGFGYGMLSFMCQLSTYPIVLSTPEVYRRVIYTLIPDNIDPYLYRNYLYVISEIYSTIIHTKIQRILGGLLIRIFIITICNLYDTPNRRHAA